MDWIEVDQMYIRIRGVLSDLDMPDDEIRGIAQSMLDAGLTPEAHAMVFSMMLLDPNSETAGGIRSTDIIERWPESIDMLCWAAVRLEDRQLASG